VRLSYTPISLLQFFLITFLTLFLKPDARAQSMLAVNFTKHHFTQESAAVEIIKDEVIHPDSISARYDESVNSRYRSTIDFLRSPAPVLLIPDSHRIFTAYHAPLIRIYSANIQHSMHISVKFFKVVIVPLWYARGAGQ